MPAGICSTFAVAIQMLVSGLAADAELRAKLREREAVALCQHAESNDLFHRGVLVPGHYP